MHEINLNLAIVEETLSMITRKQIYSPINSANHHLIFEIPEEHNNDNQLSKQVKSVENSEHYFISLSAQGTPESVRSLEDDSLNYQPLR